MKLSLNEGQMTISMDFAATDEKPITVEEVLIGAYDIISPNNEFKVKLQALFTSFPEIDLKAMGFNSHWEKEPLWMSSVK